MILQGKHVQAPNSRRENFVAMVCWFRYHAKNVQLLECVVISGILYPKNISSAALETKTCSYEPGTPKETNLLRPFIILNWITAMNYWPPCCPFPTSQKSWSWPINLSNEKQNPFSNNGRSQWQMTITCKRRPKRHLRRDFETSRAASSYRIATRYFTPRPQNFEI